MVAFTPAGDRVASAKLDGTIQVWDAATGDLVWDSAAGAEQLSTPPLRTPRPGAKTPRRGHDGGVTHLSFNPDGTVLMSSGLADGMIRFWDAALGTPWATRSTWARPGSPPTSARPARSSWWPPTGSRSPSGTWPAGRRSGAVERARRVAPGRGHLQRGRGHGIPGHQRRGDLPVERPDPAADRRAHRNGAQRQQRAGDRPEGATLAFAGSSDELYLMSPTLHAHTLFDDLTGGEDPTAMAISPDGATVATAHAGGEILVWNAEDGSAIGDPLLGHDDTIFALDFNHDGTQLASASRDGTARIWEVGGGPQSRLVLPIDVAGSGTAVYELDFSPAGDLLATGASDGTIQLWHTSDGTPAGAAMSMLDAVWSVTFDPQGQTIAAADANGLITFWNVAEGGFTLDPIASSQSSITSIRFVDGGNALASASSDGTIFTGTCASAKRSRSGRRSRRGDPVRGRGGCPRGRRVANGDERRRLPDRHHRSRWPGPALGNGGQRAPARAAPRQRFRLPGAGLQPGRLADRVHQQGA